MLYKVVLTFESQIKCMIIQMKATEQYFPVVLFIMLYKMVPTSEFVGEPSKCDIQIKAIAQRFLARGVAVV